MKGVNLYDEYEESARITTVEPVWDSSIEDSSKADDSISSGNWRATYV